MESRELQAGTTLNNGKYTIEKLIGSGGFGITYKAVQSGLNRAICIKEYFLDGKCVRNTVAKTVHLQGVSEDAFEKYRQRFVEEAQMLATLRHQNIVEVIDVFDENNTSYMVMPFIEGQTLQSLVEKNGALDYGMTVNYLGQIASAVSYIHSKNILHRDIKPDNILITPSHHAILIDFGSAREFVNDKTQAHTSIFTKCYAPPEQYNTVSRKGNYTDIYSLGAVYYFAMTGKTPLEAATRQIEKMPDPKELNPAITDDANRTILKAMALKPENRHQSMDEFLDDLLGKRPSEPIVDDTEIIVKKSRKKIRQLVIITTVIFCLCIGGGFWYIQQSRQKQEQREQQSFREASQKANELFSQSKFSSALEFCNQALKIKSDDAGMQELQKQIEVKFKEREDQKFIDFKAKAIDYFDFAKNTDVAYSNTALNFCDSALFIKPDDAEMKRLKVEIKKLINN